MKTNARNSLCRFWGLVIVVFALSACASGPYYTVSQTPSAPPPPSPQSGSPPSPPDFAVGFNEFNYTLEVYDRTPFHIQELPRSLDVLYRKGYDEVRRKRDADLAITVTLSAGAAENPEKRVGQALGGALGGAALGAIIGGALGDPGPGAGFGAASGAVVGAMAPATDYLVRIDVSIYSKELGRTSFASRTINVSKVPPHAVSSVVDEEVAILLRSLPDR